VDVSTLGIRTLGYVRIARYSLEITGNDIEITREHSGDYVMVSRDDVKITSNIWECVSNFKTGDFVDLCYQ